MSAVFKSQPIPADDSVTPGAVATAASVQLKRVSQAGKSAAGIIKGRRLIDASTFAASTDGYIGAKTGAGAISLRLPKCTEYPTMELEVERYSGGNTFTVTPRGTDTIDGAASLVVTTKVKLQPINNSDWHATP